MSFKKIKALEWSIELDTDGAKSTRLPRLRDNVGAPCLNTLHGFQCLIFFDTRWFAAPIVWRYVKEYSGFLEAIKKAVSRFPLID